VIRVPQIPRGKTGKALLVRSEVRMPALPQPPDGSAPAPAAIAI
jgi:hypothetical protein